MKDLALMINHIIRSLNQGIALDKEQLCWIQSLVKNRAAISNSAGRKQWELLSTHLEHSGMINDLNDEEQYQLYFLLQQEYDKRKKELS